MDAGLSGVAFLGSDDCGYGAHTLCFGEATNFLHLWNKDSFATYVWSVCILLFGNEIFR